MLLLESVENALSTFDKADLSKFLWRQQEEVLDCLRNKRVFQPYDPDLSLQRPAHELDHFQSSASHIISDQSIRQRGQTQASAYQALDGVRSPNTHHISDLHTFTLEPLRDQRTCIRGSLSLNEITARQIC